MMINATNSTRTATPKIAVFGEHVPDSVDEFGEPAQGGGGIQMFDQRDEQGGLAVPARRELVGLRILVVTEDSRAALVTVGIALAYQVQVLATVDLGIDHHMVETVPEQELAGRIREVLAPRRNAAV